LPFVHDGDFGILGQIDFLNEFLEFHLLPLVYVLNIVKYLEHLNKYD
jgi:hypothetical protein